MADFLYELCSDEKITCPSCNEEGCFVRYKNASTGEYLEGDFGRCDRENNCGHFKMPENNRPLESESSYKEEYISILDTDYIPDRIITGIRKLRLHNDFLRTLIGIFGKNKVLDAYEKYKLCTWYDNSIIFPYYSYGLHSGKIIWYDESLHRIKDGNKGRIQWLHNCNYRSDDGQMHGIYFEGKHTIPLFGHHLIVKESNRLDTYICLVEAEKTAFIMSMIYPQYIWLATGGLRNVQKYKFYMFQRCKVLVFSDMGIVKADNISVRDMWKAKLNDATSVVDIRYSFVNYIPYFITNSTRDEWSDAGKDVLDFIFEFKDEWMKDGYISYLDYLTTMIEEAKLIC